MSKTPRYLVVTMFCLLAALGTVADVHAERETFLKQIRLPHNYYYREMYVPRLTAGPYSLAWNDGPGTDIFDRFPYATTNPVFVEVDGQPLRSQADADYFIDWIDRVYEQLSGNKHYNDELEKQAVLSSIESARAVFENRR